MRGLAIVCLAGAIGTLNMVEARYNRNSAIGRDALRATAGLPRPT